MIDSCLMCSQCTDLRHEVLNRDVLVWMLAYCICLPKVGRNGFVAKTIRILFIRENEDKQADLLVEILGMAIERSIRDLSLNSEPISAGFIHRVESGCGWMQGAERSEWSFHSQASQRGRRRALTQPLQKGNERWLLACGRIAVLRPACGK